MRTLVIIGLLALVISLACQKEEPSPVPLIAPTATATTAPTPSPAPTSSLSPTATPTTIPTRISLLAASPTPTAPVVTRVAPTEKPAPTAHCPAASPEPFWVEPVSSPTDQLSQMIKVQIGNGEVVTITTESGKFTALGSPFLVTVNLLPNTVHHLKVTAKVREIRNRGCTYGGYTFTTRLDKRGGPLVIQQRDPVLARLASTVITPDNAFQLSLSQKWCRG